MYLKWQLSPHQKAGVYCNDCHDGDPHSMKKDQAHSEGKGVDILAKTKPDKVNETCGGCHLDILEEFQKSRHYKNMDVKKRPTCSTCHYSLEGRIIDHNHIRKLCLDCHQMSVKEDEFLMLLNVEEYKEISEKSRKSVAIAKKMISYQETLKIKTVKESDISLAEELISLSEDIIHEDAIRWHQFDLHNLSSSSRKAYYLGQVAIDLLLPGKK
ncbi:MAG: hypothetical protein HQK84_05040 [Nitrospinae bacterium]|nr:hypothetical protein [Nitrospinota bacterium]